MRRLIRRLNGLLCFTVRRQLSLIVEQTLNFWLIYRFGRRCCFDCIWVDARFVSSWCYSYLSWVRGNWPSEGPGTDISRYFTVIYWVWVSQVFYDIRYEGTPTIYMIIAIAKLRMIADDGVHRFFKFIQVCLFLYIGAASGNWNPGNIRTAGSNGTFGEAAARTGT